MLDRAMPLVTDVDARETYSPEAPVTLYHGDCRDLLLQIPAESAQLIVTSPPYNIGKRYEKKRALADYLAEQSEVIGLCVDRLADGGSICWEVGNHLSGPNEVLPLDIALYPLFASSWGERDVVRGDRI